MCRVVWQEVAHVLEAVVLEKALTLKTKKNSWKDVAKIIHAQAPSTWPKTLGDSKAFNVSLEWDALRIRLQRCFSPKAPSCSVVVARARSKAIDILRRCQLYLPAEDLPLWDYCVPKMHELINKGKLSSLEASVAMTRKSKKAKAYDANPFLAPDLATRGGYDIDPENMWLPRPMSYVPEVRGLHEGFRH